MSLGIKDIFHDSAALHSGWPSWRAGQKNGWGIYFNLFRSEEIIIFPSSLWACATVLTCSNINSVQYICLFGQSINLLVKTFVINHVKRGIQISFPIFFSSNNNNNCLEGERDRVRVNPI